MSETSDSSEVESIDSDEELQQAFAEGKLKDGLNLGVNVPKQFKNDVMVLTHYHTIPAFDYPEREAFRKFCRLEGMEKKLNELKQSLDWIERLDMTNDPSPPPKGSEDILASQEEDLVHDDFKREMKFYRQGQAAVLLCLEKLHKINVKTKRPEDYFAEMAKSDVHMKKVREKLLEKQKNIEMREKARKLRDLKKYGKKVQQEVMLKRHKEKREMLDAVKKFRKGQKDQLDFLEDIGGKSSGEKKQKKVENTSQSPGKKRQFKNKKFGFGGQKKRSKMNTKESTNDPNMFKQRGLKGKPNFNKKKGNKVKRPGKSKRVALKNKKKR